jgi:hypothetical protein
LVEAAELADDYDADPDAFTSASKPNPTATPDSDYTAEGTLLPGGRRMSGRRGGPGEGAPSPGVLATQARQKARGAGEA